MIKKGILWNIVKAVLEAIEGRWKKQDQVSNRLDLVFRLMASESVKKAVLINFGNRIMARGLFSTGNMFGEKKCCFCRILIENEELDQKNDRNWTEIPIIAPALES